MVFTEMLLTDEGVKPDSLLINHDETEWWGSDWAENQRHSIYDQLVSYQS